MKLRDAVICLNCDEVYSAKDDRGNCPRCGDYNYRYITHWLGPVYDREQPSPYAPNPRG